MLSVTFAILPVNWLLLVAEPIWIAPWSFDEPIAIILSKYKAIPCVPILSVLFIEIEDAPLLFSFICWGVNVIVKSPLTVPKPAVSKLNIVHVKTSPSLNPPWD